MQALVAMFVGIAFISNAVQNLSPANTETERSEISLETTLPVPTADLVADNVDAEIAAESGQTLDTADVVVPESVSLDLEAPMIAEAPMNAEKVVAADEVVAVDVAAAIDPASVETEVVSELIATEDELQDASAESDSVEFICVEPIKLADTEINFVGDDSVDTALPAETSPISPVEDARDSEDVSVPAAVVAETALPEAELEPVAEIASPAVEEDFDDELNGSQTVSAEPGSTDTESVTAESVPGSEVLQAWPHLSDHTRAAILMLIQADQVTQG